MAGITNTPAADLALLALTAAGLLLTAATLRAALRDRADLRRCGLNGLTERWVCASIRHESLRLSKHVILVGVMACWAWDVPNLPGIRNAAVLAVAALLALNSLWDLVDRRRIVRWSLSQRLRERAGDKS